VGAVAPSSGSAYMPRELWWVPPPVRWGNAWAETGRGVGLGLASFVQVRMGFCGAKGMARARSFEEGAPYTRMTQSCCRRKGRAAT
jgi:hypothetical protein